MSSSTMGLLDFNTSDGRFLFIIPWQGHTLIGTTDTKSPAETLPQPPDEDIRWILKESSKYYSHSTPPLSTVMSAWRGWRPLAVDPNAAPGSPVSRDHVISQDPSSGVYFIAGGKWTTWREMAQDVVDRALGTSRPCHTLTLPLVGAEGCK
jgi:glycerol-3-phosphate dehydrogenase